MVEDQAWSPVSFRCVRPIDSRGRSCSTFTKSFQIIDYRDEAEILDKPDVIWQGAHYVHAPANPLAKEVTANLDKLTPEILEQFDPQALCSVYMNYYH